MPDAFHWLDGATVTCAVTSASADFPLVPAGKLPTGKLQLRFYNSGTVTVFVKKGANGTPATAATTDFPIAPGATEVLTVNNNPSAPITSIAAISAVTAATLYVTPGAGL